MKKYLADFFELYNYPRDAVKTLTEAYNNLENEIHFTTLLHDFYRHESITREDVDRTLDISAAESGVHEYTVKLLFYICLSKQLKEQYNARNIDESIYLDSMDDLRCKLIECHDVKGIWGSFVSQWFYYFYRFTLFGLGRLEYELKAFPRDSMVIDGVEIKKGQTVVNIHIPSSGKPFDLATRRDSYKKAYEFFKDKLGDNPVFICHSWLLNPDHIEILSPKSNIVSFMNDFTIISSDVINSNDNDLWRIFGKDSELSPEKLPRKSSLQNAYADYLSADRKPLAGFGVFVYRP